MSEEKFDRGFEEGMGAEPETETCTPIREATPRTPACHVLDALPVNRSPVCSATGDSCALTEGKRFALVRPSAEEAFRVATQGRTGLGYPDAETLCHADRLSHPKGSRLPLVGVNAGDDDKGVRSSTCTDGIARDGALSHNRLERMLSKMPPSFWQPNVVVRRHRRTAHAYWVLLLAGYAVYIILAIRDALDRGNNPPVQLTHIEEPFQTWASASRYNRTGYTTPEGYVPAEDYIVLLPDAFSDTCRRFRLSTLSALEDATAWRFHMLMFWNSSYDPLVDSGAFESIKMYLYEGDLEAEEVMKTPITLYAPFSFDASVVPFVRGFLQYKEQVFLDTSVERTYSVVDMTSSQWRDAEDAVEVAATHGTDSLASIQLDIRSLSFYQYKETDPVDIVGTLGEISGFWLAVPLLFGLLFYKRERADANTAEMRSIKICDRFDAGRAAKVANCPSQLP